METFVFSYERGAFLNNFLRSVREVGLEADVTVVDDGSSQRATLEALDSAEEAGFRVVRRRHRASSARGGLRANMQFALDLAKGPVTLFAQDDMQFVRRLGPGEEERITSLVADPENSPLLFPAFHLRGWKASQRDRTFDYSEALGMPLRTPLHPLPGFSDVAVFAPDRLRSVGLDYKFEESGTSILAFREFGPMASYPYPFLAFLPAPSIPRLGRRYRMRHLQRRSTPAILNQMTAADVERLFAADPSALPFAEDWLTVRSRTRRWSLRSSGWVG